MSTAIPSKPQSTAKSLPKPIPESSPQQWVYRILGVAALAAIAVYLAETANPSTLGKVTEACILAIAAVSLNLLIGFNGQISIGHSTFVGLAAFTAGYAVNNLHWNAYWSLVLGLVICFVLGLLLGLPALRLKGPYLALVTLAVAFVWPTIAKKFLEQKVKKTTLKGSNLLPPSWTGLASKGKFARLDKAIYIYWVAIVLLVIAYVVVRNLRKSRIGRSLVAVRDNETAAAVMGVNLKFTKTVTFGVSAAIAGSAGWLSAAHLATFNDTSFTILSSIRYLLALFLGGAATLTGPIVGAFAYYFLDDYLRTHAPHWTWLPGQLSKGPIASFLLGAIVIAFVFIAPFGLVGFVKEQVRRVFVVTPRPLRPAEAPIALAERAEELNEE
ncbi:MAG: transporter permease [Ilumatobacteraceae bacterium]|nr:transporter permease [Ilumatobacteraceae bacterium]